MTTIKYNGIELAQKKDGTVEVFCDRPSVVSITKLIDTLTLLSGTSKEAPSSSHSLQAQYNLLAKSNHTPEPGATR
jgi:hypothetical protein